MVSDDINRSIEVSKGKVKYQLECCDNVSAAWVWLCTTKGLVLTSMWTSGAQGFLLPIAIFMPALCIRVALVLCFDCALTTML